MDNNERMAKIVETIDGQIVETPCRIMSFVVGETRTGAVVALGGGEFVYVPMENLRQECPIIGNYKRKYEELVAHIDYKAKAAAHWLKSPARFTSKKDVIKMEGELDAFNMMLCYSENENY